MHQRNATVFREQNPSFYCSSPSNESDNEVADLVAQIITKIDVNIQRTTISLFYPSPSLEDSNFTNILSIYINNLNCLSLPKDLNENYSYKLESDCVAFHLTHSDTKEPELTDENTILKTEKISITVLANDSSNLTITAQLDGVHMLLKPQHLLKLMEFVNSMKQETMKQASSFYFVGLNQSLASESITEHQICTQIQPKVNPLQESISSEIMSESQFHETTQPVDAGTFIMNINIGAITGTIAFDEKIDLSHAWNMFIENASTKRAPLNCEHFYCEMEGIVLQSENSSTINSFSIKIDDAEVIHRSKHPTEAFPAFHEELILRFNSNTQTERLSFSSKSSVLENKVKVCARIAPMQLRFNWAIVDRLLSMFHLEQEDKNLRTVQLDDNPEAGISYDIQLEDVALTVVVNDDEQDKMQDLPENVFEINASALKITCDETTERGFKEFPWNVQSNGMKLFLKNENRSNHQLLSIAPQQNSPFQVKIFLGNNQQDNEDENPLVCDINNASPVMRVSGVENVYSCLDKSKFLVFQTLLSKVSQRLDKLMGQLPEQQPIEDSSNRKLYSLFQFDFVKKIDCHFINLTGPNSVLGEKHSYQLLLENTSYSMELHSKPKSMSTMKLQIDALQLVELFPDSTKHIIATSTSGINKDKKPVLNLNATMEGEETKLNIELVGMHVDYKVQLPEDDWINCLLDMVFASPTLSPSVQEQREDKKTVNTSTNSGESKISVILKQTLIEYAPKAFPSRLAFFTDNLAIDVIARASSDTQRDMFIYTHMDTGQVFLHSNFNGRLSFGDASKTAAQELVRTNGFAQICSLNNVKLDVEMETKTNKAPTVVILRDSDIGVTMCADSFETFTKVIQCFASQDDISDKLKLVDNATIMQFPNPNYAQSSHHVVQQQQAKAPQVVAKPVVQGAIRASKSGSGLKVLARPPVVIEDYFMPQPMTTKEYGILLPNYPVPLLEFAVSNLSFSWNMCSGYDWPIKPAQRKRDTVNRLRLEVKDINLRYDTFKSDELWSNIFELSLHDINLFDDFQGSKKKKIIFAQESRDESQPMLSYKQEATRVSPSSNEEQLVATINIAPLHLNLSQQALEFASIYFTGINIFENTVQQQQQQEEEKEKEVAAAEVQRVPVFKSLTIGDVDICIDYTAQKPNFFALAQKNFAQLLNLISMKNERFCVSSITINDILDMNDLGNKMWDKWKAELLYNLVLFIIPCKPLVSGTLALFTEPVGSMINRRSIAHGLKKGISAFAQGFLVTVAGNTARATGVSARIFSEVTNTLDTGQVQQDHRKFGDATRQIVVVTLRPITGLMKVVSNFMHAAEISNEDVYVRQQKYK